MIEQGVFMSRTRILSKNEKALEAEQKVIMRAEKEGTAIEGDGYYHPRLGRSNSVPGTSSTFFPSPSTNSTPARKADEPSTPRISSTGSVRK